MQIPIIVAVRKDANGKCSITIPRALIRQNLILIDHYYKVVITEDLNGDLKKEGV